jgi:hypothetical protein
MPVNGMSLGVDYSLSFFDGDTGRIVDLRKLPADTELHAGNSCRRPQTNCCRTRQREREGGRSWHACAAFARNLLSLFVHRADIAGLASGSTRRN